MLLTATSAALTIKSSSTSSSSISALEFNTQKNSLMSPTAERDIIIGVSIVVDSHGPALSWGDQDDLFEGTELITACGKWGKPSCVCMQAQDTTHARGGHYKTMTTLHLRHSFLMQIEQAIADSIRKISASSLETNGYGT